MPARKKSPPPPPYHALRVGAYLTDKTGCTYLVVQRYTRPLVDSPGAQQVTRLKARRVTDGHVQEFSPQSYQTTVTEVRMPRQRTRATAPKPRVRRRAAP